MTRRTLGVALATVAVLAAAPAVNAAVTTTTKPKIDILGGASMVPNRFIQDKLRFDKDDYQIKSGTTIRIASKSPEEPHTLSVVRKSDFPKTVREFGKCFGGGACATVSKAHGFPEDGEGPPKEALVNKGAAGFDVNGDSIALGPGKGGSVKLSARAGKTLYLLCVIHPWMQAKITVK